MSNQEQIEKDVLSVYQKVNPSTYQIEKDTDEFKRRMHFMENLFLYRLHFPPKMFHNASLLEFGTGTGEHSLFYLKNGANCTFVEMNHLACTRSDNLLKKYAPDDAVYKIINNSLFNYSSDTRYDIVISLGVIHHTGNKEKAFEIKSNYLKKGGFLVLGIGNSAGAFQRNLQRTIIYQFAKNEDDVVSLANELFDEHLSRAEKFGRRDRKAIIYDSYVNPKHDAARVAEILNWFSNNGLQLYSSWPPVIPAILGDPADRSPVQFNDYPGIITLPETIYFSHSHDDKYPMLEIEQKLDKLLSPFRNLVDLLSDISPEKPVSYEDVIQSINQFQLKENQINPYYPYTKKMIRLINEVKLLIILLQKGDLENIKSFIKDSKELFQGTAGLGMSWYIAYKP